MPDGSVLSDNLFADRTFTGHPDRCACMVDTVRNYVPAGRSVRLLEIGCGTGELICRLLHEIPNATGLGLDISESNIAKARGYCASEWPDVDRRLSFQAADYLDADLDAYDVIVSDTTLHLIKARSTAALFGRVASQLRPGGVLVASIPYECLFNRALYLVRRLARVVRSRVTDQVLLACAQLLHGRRHSRAFLAERIVYMYTLPNLIDNAALRRIIQATCGLELMEQYSVLHSSIAQPKHRIVVYRKDASASSADGIRTKRIQG